MYVYYFCYFFTFFSMYNQYVKKGESKKSLWIVRVEFMSNECVKFEVNDKSLYTMINYSWMV